MMRIHREGRPTLVLAFIVLTLLNVILWIIFPIPGGMQIALAIVSIGLFIFLISFFRNPVRNTTAVYNEVIAPADGTIVVIEETMEEEYFKTKRKQLSIFMSPANVHVNRCPVGGEVKYAMHHHGKYLVAWHPKSSSENERNTTVINSGSYEILVRQVAGILARRIVNYLKVNDQVKQGEEFGFIKFGSRVDVFLPLTAEVLVQLNQKVVGGETVIAIVNSK